MKRFNFLGFLKKTTLSILIVLSACNGDKKQSEDAKKKARVADSTASAEASQKKKFISDSIARIKVDDSLKRLARLAAIENAQDSTKKLLVMSLPIDSINCDEIKKIFYQDTLKDPLEWSYYLMKVIQCQNRAYNQAHPELAVVTIAHEENGKILFNTLRVNTADKIAAATKTLISIGAFVQFGGDPEITAVVSVAGKYAVDAYLDAAKRNDPLILICPMSVVNIQLAKDGLKLTKQGFKFASKINPLEPFIIQINGAKAVFAGAQAVAKLAAAGLGVTISATGDIAKVSLKVAKTTVGLIGSGLGAPIKFLKHLF